MLFGTQILGLVRRHARGVAFVPLLVLAGLGLQGCGQKGPLYLPAPAESPSSATPTAPTTR